ncbi:MAG: glycosyltransferase, partial [Acidimicrobiales bacterium]
MICQPRPSSSPREEGRWRVLHLIKSLTVVGGAERLVLSVATARDRERFDVNVAYVLTRPSAHLIEQFVAEGVNLHCLGVASHYDLRWTLRFRALLARERFDVLHVHLPYTASFGRLAARSLGSNRRPRIVHTQHNLWQHTTPVIRALHRLTYRLGDADVAVSQAAWNALPPSLRPRTEVLVHGLSFHDIGDLASSREPVRSELGIARDEVLVSTVANMRPEKGYDLLLEAAQILISGGLPIRFVAVGHGPLEEEVRNRHAQLGLEDRFQLLGFRSDALRIVAGSDIFVLASRHEGFPVAVMEALALGVPVVSTAVGDVPLAVHNGVEGLVVPAGDVTSLADALRLLAGDASRREEMSKAARQAGLRFDIERTVRRLESIYT